jgi:hypothetical protein
MCSPVIQWDRARTCSATLQPAMPVGDLLMAAALVTATDR